MKTVTPIFLLSQPRSGSTLLQRVIGQHPEVATAPEPWLLMPFMATAGRSLPALGAWDRTTARAMADFAAVLPDGAARSQAVGAYALTLYSQAAGPDAAFFLDKTPPYSLFVDELLDWFPEGKLVVLWRNPLAVVASVVSTFCGGRWTPTRYSLSLFDTLASLVDAVERHEGRLLTVRYEDLVRSDPQIWADLTSYLGIELDATALDRYSTVDVAGALGDPTGQTQYHQVSDEPLEKWKSVVNSSVRVAWCRRYLKWIGSERLNTMGYSLDDLLGQLHDVPVARRGLLQDALDSGVGGVRRSVGRLRGDQPLGLRTLGKSESAE
jgi:hypothetical protein